ncbi:MAG: DUF1844 domain-containing protein [bacterium]|nr:DUF1844 domain-containing protein [bacterium]
MSEEAKRDDAAPTPGPEAESLPDAMTLVGTCLSLLAARAWQAMGLVPDPATKQVERKLEDAQLAIDAAAALAEVIRPRVSERERREIEALITNLRLNFVEQKSKAP